MAWEADHSPPCRTEGKKWVEFDVHSAIHHGVNSWPLLHVVLRFRMSGVWHPLRHTPSWREKLTTHLHVVLRVKNEWSMTSTPPYTMAWTADHFSMSYWGLEWVETSTPRYTFMVCAGKGSSSVSRNITVDVSRNTYSDCGCSAGNFSLRATFISASVPLLRYGLSADASYEIKQLCNLYRERGAAVHRRSFWYIVYIVLIGR